ncbi:MAG: DEAD/DEAH box helicase [Burkholderiales bacterium]
MPTATRLSALPHFLRQQSFWGGALNPKNHLSGRPKLQAWRIATGTHRWAVDANELDQTQLDGQRAAIVDIAQGILERGQWTLPSWRVEQYVAKLFRNTQRWPIDSVDASAGNLGFDVPKPRLSKAFELALLPGQWQCESSGDIANDIWTSQPALSEGSDAERRFLHEVLVPSLGLPLLNFLVLQRDLVSLGIDPNEFAGQRADFALENYRGLKLLIEVDGHQHHEPDQAELDAKRDEALGALGWTTWRVPTSELQDMQRLRSRLCEFLVRDDGTPHWGVEQPLASPRPRELLTCVWGATVCSRIEFLLLEALRYGILPWDASWEICVHEHDTDIAGEALADFADWFGRLRVLHGQSRVPEIVRVSEPQAASTQLLLDIGILEPHRPPPHATVPKAWSRPANIVVPPPTRVFTSRLNLAEPPTRELLDSFVQDYLRKRSLREGQYEILSRILTGRDVVGLLPTGGGKSLTYQIAGLLLGGLTVYVSPLKSLLQDQYERLVDLGIDLALPISSALDATQRAQASAQLTMGRLRFLLVAPERFLIDAFRDDLAAYRAQYGEVCQVVVDECHCVSEWGHEFRPAYLSLSRTVKERTERLHVSAPLVALTGTASTTVLADVQRELGIAGQDAVIRAKRLDRDEIKLVCRKLPQTEKHQVIRHLTAQFLRDHPDTNEGLLVFCRFAGGGDGVLRVAADILGTAGADQVRFFCGESPEWKKYAAMLTRIPARHLTRDQVMAHIPAWALGPHQTPRDWEDVKAEVQRQYISSLPKSFRVMVATTAFGMGIDKPSIRRVVHYMVPQSPEAYYQEVGRAGRDRKVSTAILLFSDEEPDLADRLLAPGTSIDEARRIYKEFGDSNPFEGGDFVRTFYFHQLAFAGPEAEIAQVCTTLTAIRSKLVTSSALRFPYLPESRGQARGAQRPPNWNDEKFLEYAVVRLMMLGVVRDYVKDYNAKAFKLELVPEWSTCRDDLDALREYLVIQFQGYVRRYRMRRGDAGEQQIRDALTIEGAEHAVASALVNYVYTQVERERRQATRKMLELARKGVTDVDAFRKDLLLYLQASERFTNELVEYAKDGDVLGWTEFIHRGVTADETRELHGACSRVLENYPTHPGLWSLSSVTRVAPSEQELHSSVEEFRAALRYAVEEEGLATAEALGNAMSGLSGWVDQAIDDSLHVEFATWLIQNGREQEAVSRFFVRKCVRDQWLATILKSVHQALPTIRGL